MQVASAEASNDGVNLTLQPSKGNGSTELMTADVVLVSTGKCACPVFRPSVTVALTRLSVCICRSAALHPRPKPGRRGRRH